MKFHRKYAFILSPSDGFAAGAADVLVDGLMVRLQENDADDVAVCGCGNTGPISNPVYQKDD